MNETDKENSHLTLSYDGPLPPASEFERYEKAYPGTAERVLALAEREAEVRQKNETKLIDETIKLAYKGQRAAFIISIGGLLLAAASLFVDQPILSIAPLIVALTGLVSMFLGKRS